MRYKPMHAETHVRVFFDSVFFPVRFVAKRYMTHPTVKMSEGTNINLPAMSTLVQLLALYTDPENHNAQRYRQTDRQTDGRTDGRTAG